MYVSLGGLLMYVATSSSSYYLLTSIDQYRCWWWGISLFTTKALASIGSKSITERLPSGLITLANYAASCLCITLSKMLLMASNTYQDPQLLRRAISAHSSFRIMHALKVPMKWLYRLAIDYQACELPCRACVMNMEFRYKIWYLEFYSMHRSYIACFRMVVSPHCLEAKPNQSHLQQHKFRVFWPIQHCVIWVEYLCLNWQWNKSKHYGKQFHSMVACRHICGINPDRGWLVRELPRFCFTCMPSLILLKKDIMQHVLLHFDELPSHILFHGQPMIQFMGMWHKADICWIYTQARYWSSKDPTYNFTCPDGLC